MINSFASTDFPTPRRVKHVRRKPERGVCTATSIFRVNVKRLTAKGISWPDTRFPTALDDTHRSFAAFQAQFAAAARGLQGAGQSVLPR